jgi:hypothetical protein
MDIISSPIIPSVGTGIFKLKHHLNEYCKTLTAYVDSGLCNRIENEIYIKYNFANIMTLTFRREHLRLVNIGFYSGYKGKLFKSIYVGMKCIDFASQFEVYFDEEEDLYMIKGHDDVCFTMSTYFDVEKMEDEDAFIYQINIYVDELELLAKYNLDV